MDEGSQREPAMNQITLPSGRVTEKRIDQRDGARSPLFAAQSRLSHIDLFRSLELQNVHMNNLNKMLKKRLTERADIVAADPLFRSVSQELGRPSRPRKSAHKK